MFTNRGDLVKAARTSPQWRLGGCYTIWVMTPQKAMNGRSAMTSIGKPIRTVVYDPVELPVPLQPAEAPAQLPQEPEQGPDPEPVPSRAP